MPRPNNFLTVIICSLFFLTFTVKAQKFSLAGYVKDAATGEGLIGSTVFSVENLKGVTTNTYGFYSLSLDQSKYTIVCSFLGYKSDTIKVDLSKNLTINFNLKSMAYTTKEVVIEAEGKGANLEEAQMGKIEMDITKIKELPAFLGEVDVLKSIQLLPGVQSAGDGNSGFYVRGGGPDQNLILLDEAVVYNASHLFGFFSVFNADAVKNVDLIKGGMPAQFGGRLSSVLDITMKEGNLRKTEVNGGIGLISSRLTVQGPIKKDTASYIISLRRTYIDVIAKPFIPKNSAFAGSGYYFYDINAKVNYRFSPKDRLFLSTYYGKDVFNFRDNEGDFNVDIPWGNFTTTARWNHLFNNKLFLNTSLIYSDFQFEFGASQSQFDFRLFSGIKDITSKVDFSYFPSALHTIKFGAQYINHTFIPSNVSARSGDVEFDAGNIQELYAHDIAVYANDEFDVTDKIRISAGLRYSMFQQYGPFDRYVKDEFGRISDTLSYEKGDKVVNYHGPEPRVTFRYTINSKSSVKAAYTRNLQYIHLASLSAVSLPTDIWVPSTDLVKPQIGVQYALGYFKNFKKNNYETSVEVYYKDMQNLIEYREGTLPSDNLQDNTDNNFVFGTGYSYGAEFFFKKVYGKTTGWVGYTWSKTMRNFPDLNNGIEFPAKFDRRHDLSVVVSHQYKRWTFAGTFVYATGNAITLPSQRYIYESQIVNVYGARNGIRMPDYHRMDISATWKGKENKRFQQSWTFSIFNVYNRQNPFFIYFSNEGNIDEGNLKISAKQVSLFPILPSATWNFHF